mmetsp:Transcript_14597/g.29389  ORF Transcript_14597/g.29389 Transcript_14597/m.29389 type:complete len:92 (-) Transcript_14597:3874-4149(-)
MRICIRFPALPEKRKRHREKENYYYPLRKRREGMRRDAARKGRSGNTLVSSTVLSDESNQREGWGWRAGGAMGGSEGGAIKNGRGNRVFDR